MLMTNRTWALMFLLSLLFGLSYFCTQILVENYRPLQISLMRSIVGGASLYVFCRLMRLRLPKDLSFWKSMSVLGLLNIALAASFNAAAQNHLSSSIASVMNGLTPLMTIGLSFFLLRDETGSIAKPLAGLIGLTGLAIITFNGQVPEHWSSMTGYVFCLAGTLCYALSSIYAKKQTFLGYDHKIMAIGQLIMASIWLIPMAAVNGDLFSFAKPTVIEAAAIIAMAVLSSAIAYSIYFYILTLTTATNLVFVTLLVPVTAIFLGVIVLNETMSGLQITGAIVISLSLIIADGRIFGFIRRNLST